MTQQVNKWNPFSKGNGSRGECGAPCSIQHTLWENREGVPSQSARLHVRKCWGPQHVYEGNVQQGCSDTVLDWTGERVCCHFGSYFQGKIPGIVGPFLLRFFLTAGLFRNVIMWYYWTKALAGLVVGKQWRRWAQHWSCLHIFPPQWKDVHWVDTK